MKSQDLDQLITDFYRREEETTPIPEGLESRLENLIDNLEAEEKRSQKRALPIWKWASGIAAGLAILLSIGFLFNHPTEPTLYAYEDVQSTITDPEEAYELTVEALTLISVNLNKGLNQLNRVEADLENANKIVNKTLKR